MAQAFGLAGGRPPGPSAPPRVAEAVPRVQPVLKEEPHPEESGPRELLPGCVGVVRRGQARRSIRRKVASELLGGLPNLLLLRGQPGIHAPNRTEKLAFERIKSTDSV